MSAIALEQRATVYFEPQLHHALRLKAADVNVSLSALVNAAVKNMLAEDQADLAAFAERANEPTMSYEELLNALKQDGAL